MEDLIKCYWPIIAFTTGDMVGDAIRSRMAERERRKREQVLPDYKQKKHNRKHKK